MFGYMICNFISLYTKQKVGILFENPYFVKLFLQAMIWYKKKFHVKIA